MSYRGLAPVSSHPRALSCVDRWIPVSLAFAGAGGTGMNAEFSAENSKN